MGVLFFKNYLSIQNSITTKKVSKYGVFSGPYFPVFGRNTEIQSEYRKIRTRKNSIFGHFSCSVSHWESKDYLYSHILDNQKMWTQTEK